MKVGTFIEVYGDDTTILNELFNYQTRPYGTSTRSGFPVSSLAKVETTLVSNKINYILVDKCNILARKRFNKNNYTKYRIRKDSNKKIEEVIKKIKASRGRYDIDELLSSIEKLI